jgi:hypothetical protein
LAEEGDAMTFLRDELTSETVIRINEAVVLELFGDLHRDCGNGYWCDVCREEIRSEAMLWLRELNGGPSSSVRDAADADYRLLYRWNENTLLADLSVEP